MQSFLREAWSSRGELTEAERRILPPADPAGITRRGTSWHACGKRLHAASVLVMDHLAEGSDAGQDEVDAGEELVAIVVLAQLRRHPTHERVRRRVEPRPA